MTNLKEQLLKRGWTEKTMFLAAKGCGKPSADLLIDTIKILAEGEVLERLCENILKSLEKKRHV